MAVNQKAPRQGKGNGAPRRIEKNYVIRIKKTLLSAANSVKGFIAALMRVFGVSSFTTVAVYCIVIFAIVVGGVAWKWSTQRAIDEKQRQLDQLRLQIAEQQEANAHMEELLNGDSSAAVEAQARDKLDMVRPGERVYINTVGE